MACPPSLRSLLALSAAVALTACGSEGPGADSADLTEASPIHTAIGDGGRFTLRADFPALAAGCDGACADDDADGLVDAWEDAVIDRMRPLVELDEDEPLARDSKAVMASVARVALISAEPLRVRLFLVLGYSHDPGFCLGYSSHNGDTERVVLDLARPASGGPGDVEVVGAYTAAHEGSSIDRTMIFRGDEVAAMSFVEDDETGEPRWTVFSSANKHATYLTKKLCEKAIWQPCLEEDCGADGVDDAAFLRLFPAINAGEDGARLVEDLAAIGFPGEDAWKDQKFCGGRGGEREKCSSTLRSKLVEDPFAE